MAGADERLRIVRHLEEKTSTTVLAAYTG